MLPRRFPTGLTWARIHGLHGDGDVNEKRQGELSPYTRVALYSNYRIISRNARALGCDGQEVERERDLQPGKPPVALIFGSDGVSGPPRSTLAMAAHPRWLVDVHSDRSANVSPHCNCHTAKFIPIIHFFAASRLRVRHILSRNSVMGPAVLGTVFGVSCEDAKPRRERNSEGVSASCVERKGVRRLPAIVRGARRPELRPCPGARAR